MTFTAPHYTGADDPTAVSQQSTVIELAFPESAVCRVLRFQEMQVFPCLYNLFSFLSRSKKHIQGRDLFFLPKKKQYPDTLQVSGTGFQLKPVCASKHIYKINIRRECNVI